MDSMYDMEMVRPMWEELATAGVKPLKTAQEVDEIIARPNETTLIVINSVCGCAAGNARPGVSLALQHNIIPDNLSTVFAGVDRDATQRARQHITDYPPSSPSVVLFKDGKLVYILERKQIEKMSVQSIAHNLTMAFDKYCSMPGPSVSPEVFEEMYNISVADALGSN
jgi:putative YphP/YqiW family bacilliredoxin